MAAPPVHVSSPLLPEILGYAPELLLDDIVDSVHHAVEQCVEALEPFLERWAQGQANPKSKSRSDSDPKAEIERGLVAFQTLLESHVDIAFDFFEVWCRRNIFAIPSDLPVTVPHQRGLNLNIVPERETDLLAEIDEMRRKIDHQRRLRQLLSLGLQDFEQRHERADKLFQTISFLEDLRQCRFDLLALHAEQLKESSKDLIENPTLPETPEAIRRPWEGTQAQYIQWAANRATEIARQGRGSEGSGSVFRDMLEVKENIASVDAMRRVLAVDKPRLDEQMDDSEG